MKQNKYLLEIIFSVILVIALMLCLNPFNLFMPAPIVKLLVVALLLVFGLFSVYVWKERKGDERESFHKILSGHFAFLTGSVILVIGIAVQELNGKLDPWLVIALVGMIIAKVISHIYSDKNL